jgi:hypothetical protein
MAVWLPENHFTPPAVVPGGAQPNDDANDHTTTVAHNADLAKNQQSLC